MVSAGKIMIAAAAGLAGAAIFAGSAAAQSGIADRCRSLPTEAERFACMEGALAAIEALRGGDMALPQTAAPRSSSSSRASELGAEQVDRGGNSGGGWLRMPSIPFIGGNDDDEVRPVASRGAASGELGAEQVALREGNMIRDRENDDDVVHATIVSFEEHVPGQWQFELDNGQLWRQISGDTQQVRLSRDEQPEVEMWSSWAGGYRMRIVGERQQVKVERIR